MIDTHCHLLPGIDDGAPDDAAALAMARIAVEDGVRTIVATPHSREGDFPNERPRILSRLAQLRVLLEQEKIPLELRPGSEVHLAAGLVEGIHSGRLLTYDDGGRYILLECPYRTRPIRLDETIFELKIAGITSVLAHPERIRHFQEDLSRYEEAVRLGALGQLTSSSLVGVFGRTIQQLSEEMVRRRLVHILASDAHDGEYRPPRLAAARERWAQLGGEESARLATETHPLALLEGSPIQPPPPLPAGKQRWFLGRILGRR